MQFENTIFYFMNQLKGRWLACESQYGFKTYQSAARNLWRTIKEARVFVFKIGHRSTSRPSLLKLWIIEIDLLYKRGTVILLDAQTRQTPSQSKKKEQRTCAHTENFMSRLKVPMLRWASPRRSFFSPIRYKAASRIICMTICPTDIFGNEIVLIRVNASVWSTCITYGCNQPLWFVGEERSAPGLSIRVRISLDWTKTSMTCREFASNCHQEQHSK